MMRTLWNLHMISNKKILLHGKYCGRCKNMNWNNSTWKQIFHAKQEETSQVFIHCSLLHHGFTKKMPEKLKSSLYRRVFTEKSRLYLDKFSRPISISFWELRFLGEEFRKKLCLYFDIQNLLKWSNHV